MRKLSFMLMNFWTPQFSRSLSISLPMKYIQFMVYFLKIKNFWFDIFLSKDLNLILFWKAPQSDDTLRLILIELGGVPNLGNEELKDARDKMITLQLTNRFAYVQGRLHAQTTQLPISYSHIFQTHKLRRRHFGFKQNAVSSRFFASNLLKTFSNHWCAR